MSAGVNVSVHTSFIVSAHLLAPTCHVTANPRLKQTLASLMSWWQMYSKAERPSFVLINQPVLHRFSVNSHRLECTVPRPCSAVCRRYCEMEALFDTPSPTAGRCWPWNQSDRSVVSLSRASSQKPLWVCCHNQENCAWQNVRACV